MAQTSFPFESIDTSETQFSQWARNIGEGVRAGAGSELLPFGDSSGMTVKVSSGQSMIRGHYYVSTATEFLTVTTADPTNPRIDNVVLELDPAANTILLKVVAGTPAGSPVAPALIQTDSGIWQQLIARVAVAAGATTISAGNVTDSRTFLPIIGGDVAGSSVVGELTNATINASKIITTVNDKAANYTLVAADENTFIRSTNAAITITVPDVLANGESVNFVQAGTGQITFAGSGVTLNSADGKLLTAKQYAGATITKLGGAYYLIGNLG